MTEVDNTVSGSPVDGVTQDTTTEPSPALESGNEGNESNSQEPQTDWKVKYEEVNKRYSDSSREAMKFKEQAETSQQELIKTITKDRKIYEQYVNDKQLPPEEKEYYMNLYDTQIAQNNLVQQGQVTETTSANTSPSVIVQPKAPADPVREQWMNRMDAQERQKREQQSQATREFFENQANKELPYAVQESIRATAAMLDQEYGYKPAEALQVAKKRILEPESIRDEGYTEGVRDSMSGGLSRGGVGGSSTQQSKTKLPAKHEAFVLSEIARKGLDSAAAEKYRKSYAERLAER